MMWQILLRVPSFWTAYSVSIVVLLVFVCWHMVDASFLEARQVIHADLGLEQRPIGTPLMWRSLHRWKQLGSRMLLYGVLVSFAMAAGCVLCYRVTFGAATDRSLQTWLLSIGLVAMWLALLVARNALDSVGFRFRIALAMPGFRMDAQHLLAQWPTTNGVLPFAGEFIVDSANPRNLLTKGDRYQVRESIGPMITQLPDGGMAFDLATRAFGRMEYHPKGGKPQSFTSSFYYAEGQQEVLHMEETVESYSELESGWYLVFYSHAEADERK